ncbi:MAG TPA: GTPase domain-containing protein, partial [Desulfatiglandales bacterium]|nr:GTPase domain-containing protein [Desulfatiglandales bacterium]
VPGQIRYNATRKLVLKGADAVVFVADSQRDMREQNMESFVNMRENLTANNLNLEDITVVLQYNKRDLAEILTVGELNAYLNENNYATVEAIATLGKGVQETFRLVTTLLLKDIARKHRVEIGPPKEEGVPVKAGEKEPFDAGAVEPEAAPAMKQTPAAAALRREMFLSQDTTPEETTPYETEPILPPFRKTEEVPLRARPVLQRTAPYVDERITSVLSMLREMNQSLGGLREMVSTLSKDVKESGRQQMEITRILRELSASSADKKSWWSRLFSR